MSMSLAGRRRTVWAALLATCVLTIALRVVGLNWGLPFLYHPDESFNFTISQRMLKALDPNPHFFKYPSFFLYFNALIEAAYFAVCRAAGTLHTLKDLRELDVPVMGSGYSALPSAFLTVRAMSVAFGVGTVAIIYRVGRFLSPRVEVALLAALFVATSPLILRETRWITPEGLLTLTVASALLASLQVWRFGRARDLIWASVLTGLAASVKYNGVFVALAVGLAAILHYRKRVFRSPWVYAAPLIAAGSFVLTTPYAVLDSSHFWRDLTFERAHYATGHTGAEGNTLAFYCRYLWDSEGVIACFFLAGVVLGVVRRNQPVLIISAYCLAYFCFINSLVLRNGRSLVPIVPGLLAVAAWFISEALTWLNARTFSQKLPRAFRNSISLLLLALTVTPPLHTSLTETRSLLWQDNREAARVWVEANVPPHSRFAIEAYACYVDRHRYRLRSITDLEPRWLAQHADYVILSGGSYDRFVIEPTRYPEQLALYQAIFNEFELVKSFNDAHGGSEIRIYRTHPRPARNNG